MFENHYTIFEPYSANVGSLSYICTKVQNKKTTEKNKKSRCRAMLRELKIIFFSFAGSSGGYGKKKGKYSTLKKAAVIGAVAYGSYQIGKMSTGYNSWHNHPRG